MSPKTIMVQLAEREITVEAMHMACQRARKDHAVVTLVHLSRVQRMEWLGALDTLDLPRGTTKQTALECASIAAQYGVELTLQPFQYYSLSGALVDAADYVDAAMVFASLPHSLLPLVYRIQASQLQRHLAEHGRDLVLANGNGSRPSTRSPHLNLSHR
jgi:hypothetical protein